ncbi:hypothetical protein VE23_16440 [Paenibacillus sp. D9]|nr:hypothetical protein VE23_16440 [Paenibacillus sp. D9]
MPDWPADGVLEEPTAGSLRHVADMGRRQHVEQMAVRMLGRQLLDVLEIEAGTRDAEFFSFTIDPERDTAEALIKYSEKLEADPSGWDFLRGEEAGNFDILVMKDEGGTLSLVNLRGCYMFHAIVTARNHSRRC